MSTDNDKSVEMISMKKELGRLYADNARLAGEVESLRKAEGIMCAEIDLKDANLKRQKEALEKARVALVKSFDIKTSLPAWLLDARDDALADINTLK